MKALRIHHRKHLRVDLVLLAVEGGLRVEETAGQATVFQILQRLSLLD